MGTFTALALAIAIAIIVSLWVLAAVALIYERWFWPLSGNKTEVADKLPMETWTSVDQVVADWMTNGHNPSRRQCIAKTFGLPWPRRSRPWRVPPRKPRSLPTVPLPGLPLKKIALIGGVALVLWPTYRFVDGWRLGSAAAPKAATSQPVDPTFSADHKTFLNCAGIMAAVSKAFVNGTGAEIERIQRDTYASYERFSERVYMLAPGSNFVERVQRSKPAILAAANAYVDRIAADRERYEGGFGEDKAFVAELDACRQLDQQLRN
jgi:hypothetical protein